GLTAGHLSRRAFMARVAALGLSATAVGALLSACGATGGAPATTAPVAPTAVVPPAVAGGATATATNVPTVAATATPTRPAAATPAGAASPAAAPKAYIGLFKDNAIAVFDTGANR